jgi:alpha-2-macroglobulin
MKTFLLFLLVPILVHARDKLIAQLYSQQVNCCCRGPLRVLFSDPMIPLGFPTDSTPKGLSITPAIRGNWSWGSKSTLLFTPDSAWPGGVEFTVLVPAGIQSEISKKTLKKAYKENFIAGLFYGGFENPHDLRTTVEFVDVQFSMPVDLDSLRKHVSTSGAPEPLQISALGSQGFRLRPQSGWPGGKKITLSIDAGLTSRGGNLPLDSVISTTFLVGDTLACEGLFRGEEDKKVSLSDTLFLENDYYLQFNRNLRSIDLQDYFLINNNFTDLHAYGDQIHINQFLKPGALCTLSFNAGMPSGDDAFLFHDIRFVLVGDFNKIDPALQPFSIKRMNVHWGSPDSSGPVSWAAPIDLKPTLNFELVPDEIIDPKFGKMISRDWNRSRGLIFCFSQNGNDTFSATYDSTLHVYPRRLPANSNCTLVVKAGFRAGDRQLKRDFTTIFRTGKIIFANECLPIWGREYNNEGWYDNDDEYVTGNNAADKPDHGRYFHPIINLFPESPSVPLKRFGPRHVVVGVRRIEPGEIVSPLHISRSQRNFWKFDTLAGPAANVNWYEYIPLRLAPALFGKGMGIADVMMSVDGAPFDTLGRYQSTDLGMQLMSGRVVTAVSVTSLTKRTPVAGASVTCIGNKGTMLAMGKTDSTGLFRIRRHIAPKFIVATFLDDTLVYKTEAPDKAISFDTLECRGDIITDRDLYRTGDTIFFKGIVRRLRDRWEPMAPDTALVTIQWKGGKPFIDTLPLAGCGFFSGYCVVPNDVSRKSYEIKSTLIHSEAILSGGFRVADFRPIELRAEVRKGFIEGNSISFPVSANWLHGAAVESGSLSWSCTFHKVGRNYPSDRFIWKGLSTGYSGNNASGDSHLDKTGHAVIDVPYLPEDSGAVCDFSVTVTASAMQTVQVRGKAEIPRSHRLRIGFAQDRDGSENDTVLLRFMAMRENGDTGKGVKLRTEIVHHKIVKRTVKNRCGLPKIVRDTLHSLARTDFPTTDSTGVASLQMAKVAEGRYTVAVLPQGKEGQDAFTYDFHVSKSDTARRHPEAAVHRSLDERDTFNIAEKDTGVHGAGDTVRLRLTSSRDSCRVLLMVSRENLYEHKWIAMTGRDTTVPLVVKDAYIPDVKIQASFFPPVRRNSRGLAIMPHGLISTQSIELHVSEESRRIAVKVKTDRAAYAPGDSVLVHCVVPRKFRFATALVMAVDEGELQRSNAQLPNISEAFSMDFVGVDHFKTECSFRSIRGPFDYDSLNGLRQYPRYPRQGVAGIGFGAGYGSGFGGGVDDIIGGLLGDGESSIGISMERAIRRPPLPCAYFNPRVSFNVSGEAMCRFVLPGNLTRWRVTVVVDDTASFGVDTTTFTSSKPLMVRPQIPRFLRLGDSATAVYIVENRSETERIISSSVIMKSDTVTGRIKLLTDETRQCRFLLIGRAVGQDSLLFLARSDSLGDGIKVSLPVICERPRDVAAIAGSTMDSVKIPVLPPKPGTIDSGCLALSLATTRMQNLREGVRYLFEYPYGCLEQRSSKVLPLLLMKDFARRFDLPMLAQGDEKKAVQNYLDHIADFQNDSNGGLCYWPNRQEGPSPWLTAFALEIMNMAKTARYDVVDSVYSKALKYLLREMKKKDESGRKQFIDSYTLLVVAEAGKPNRAELRKLYKKERSLPFAGRIDLLRAMYIAGGFKKQVADLQKKLMAGLIEKDRLAYVAEAQVKGFDFCHESQVRLTALTLEALLETGSKSRFDEPMVRWLAEQRRAGRWRTTQENCTVFRAFSAYTAAYETEAPKIIATARFAGADWFKALLDGREGAMADASKPLDSLSVKGTTEVSISRSGSGRLYYDLLLNTFPKGAAQSVSSGLTIRRTVSGIGLSGKTPSERAQLRVGDLVKVELTIQCDQDINFAAISDPVPAGCEAVNPDLKGGEQKTASDITQWSGPAGLSYKEFRDSHVLLFADNLLSGEYRFSYLLKPTTAGTFLWPAPFTEAMYYPEIFGRGVESIVTIGERP